MTLHSVPACNIVFWISAPFSRFLPTSTYIGKTKLIQWQPCPYQRGMDSSAHMALEGEKRCVWYSLKLITKYSTSFHQRASWIVPSPCISGWWFHRTLLQSILQRYLFMTVLTKTGDDLYFDWETVDPVPSLYLNSKRVARIIIPNHFIISPLDFPFSPYLTNLFLQRPLRPLSTLVLQRERTHRDVTSTTTWRALIARYLLIRTWRALIARQPSALHRTH